MTIQKEITVEVARRRLGERAKHMTDQQILNILNMLRFVCNKVIMSVVKEEKI